MRARVDRLYAGLIARRLARDGTAYVVGELAQLGRSFQLLLQLVQTRDPRRTADVAFATGMALARSPLRKQAIAIGLSKARRSGVKVKPPAPGKASAETRRKAARTRATHATRGGR